MDVSVTQRISRITKLKDAKIQGTTTVVSTETVARNGYTNIVCPDCGVPVKLCAQDSFSREPYFKQAFNDDERKHKPYCRKHMNHRDYDTFDEIQTTPIDEILQHILNNAVPRQHVFVIDGNEAAFVEKHVRQHLYLNTAKELFKYCSDHSIENILPNCESRVGDVLIDNRNAIQSIGKNLTGTKIFYGLTKQFCDIDRSITFRVSTYPGEEVIGRLLFPDNPNGRNSHFRLKQIIRKRSAAYTENGKKRFAGVPIAAIGDWQAYKENKSFVNIENVKQVLYAF
jgi:hypothetical protein